jgi:hypothetical protein
MSCVRVSDEARKARDARVNEKTEHMMWGWGLFALECRANMGKEGNLQHGSSSPLTRLYGQEALAQSGLMMHEWRATSDDGFCSGSIHSSSMPQPQLLMPSVQIAYEPVIGLEIHAQILSKSKAFSSAPTSFAAPVNSHVRAPFCPTCFH